MFDKILIIPYVAGIIFSYPFVIAIDLVSSNETNIFMIMFFVGLYFTVIGVKSGFSLGFLYQRAYRESEPDRYWFWMGHYMGFMLWSIFYYIKL